MQIFKSTIFNSLFTASQQHDCHVTSSPEDTFPTEAVFYHSRGLPWSCLYFQATYYNTIFANVDIGADLRSVDHAILLYEDMVSDVQWKERHSGGKWGKQKQLKSTVWLKNKGACC